MIYGYLADDMELGMTPLSDLIYWMLITHSAFKIASTWKLHLYNEYPFSDSRSRYEIIEDLRWRLKKQLIDFSEIESHLRCEIPSVEWLYRFERYVIPFMIKYYR